MQPVTHPDHGLKLCEVYIDDGTIKMDLGDKYLVIGELDILLSLPPYQGGQYETVNGLEVDIEQFINDMGIPPFDAKEIKYASTTAESHGEMSDRFGEFNSYLHSQLEGDIARKDGQGNIVCEMSSD